MSSLQQVYRLYSRSVLVNILQIRAARRKHTSVQKYIIDVITALNRINCGQMRIRLVSIFYFMG